MYRELLPVPVAVGAPTGISNQCIHSKILSLKSSYTQRTAASMLRIYSGQTYNRCLVALWPYAYYCGAQHLGNERYARGYLSAVVFVLLAEETEEQTFLLADAIVEESPCDDDEHDETQWIGKHYLCRY